MVLPITQTPVYNNPYRPSPGNPSFAMSPPNMPYPYPATPQSKGGMLQNLISGVFPQMSGGSGINADSIMGKLDQLQRVLGVVQKGAPIIQQYGPMIKQLPAMLQMIKALNNADTEEEPEDGNSNPQNEAADIAFNEDSFTNDNAMTQDNNEEEQPSLKQSSSGQSTPKLFI